MRTVSRWPPVRGTLSYRRVLRGQLTTRGRLNIRLPLISGRPLPWALKGAPMRRVRWDEIESPALKGRRQNAPGTDRRGPGAQCGPTAQRTLDWPVEAIAALAVPNALQGNLPLIDTSDRPVRGMWATGHLIRAPRGPVYTNDLVWGRGVTVSGAMERWNHGEARPSCRSLGGPCNK
jgi:hypothetical protein